MPRPAATARTTFPTAAVLAALLVLTAGCAQQGDFGRPKPGAWNGLIETTGTLAARERGEPA